MDLNAQGNSDFNFFPQNPNWQFLLTNNSQPDVTQLCPVHSDNTIDWKNSPTCTNDDIYLNQATGFNQIDCWVHGRAIQGHMNWMPVCYQGSLFWDNHSDPPGDDDYNFDLCRNDKALYTINRISMHTEFDSDETVDHWDGTSTWWDNFHNAVDDDNDKAHSMLNGRFAIVIGLLGIDGGHEDYKSELHPAYGMFIHTNDDPGNDKWAFFIRNWGDEGSCSSNQEYLDRNTMLVFLPHENTDDVTLDNLNVWVSNMQPGMNFTFQKQKDGVLLIFTFDQPEKKSCFFGDLGFVWKGQNLSPRNDLNLNPLNVSSQSSALQERELVDEKLLSRVNQLDVNSKKELMAILNGKIHSEKFNLFPKPALTQLKAINRMNINIDSIQKEMATLKKNNRFPVTNKLIRTVADSATFRRKQMRYDLIQNYLKAKGIS